MLPINANEYFNSAPDIWVNTSPTKDKLFNYLDSQCSVLYGALVNQKGKLES